VYEQFAASVVELRAYGGLPVFAQAGDLWQNLWHMEVHHSTAVEGNTLVLREVEVLLQQGRAVGAKELKDYLEVVGYAEASRWVFDQAGPGRSYPHDDLVTLTELRHLHTMAMTRVWDVTPHPFAEPAEAPGGFRTREIAAFPGGMKPSTFPVVPALIDAWISDVNDFGQSVRHATLAFVDLPPELARIHAGYERIHPFLDGNGRTGRLLLNLMLTRLGLAPVVILTSQRQRYLSALGKADTDDTGPLAELLAQASIASLHRLLPRIATTTDLVPLAALADERLSLPALRQAVSRGRLEAVMDGHGVWRSNRQSVDAYWASRQRRPNPPRHRR